MGSATGGAGARTEATVRVTRNDVLLLVALAVLWGSAYVAIREGIVAGASPFLFAGARYAIVAGLLALVATVRREAWPSQRSVLLSALVGGTLIIGFYGMLLYWGEQFTTGGYASVLSGMGPILTVVFAYSLLPSERLSRVAVAGIALGFVGILVLVLPSLLGGVGGGWMGPVAVMGAFVVFPLGTVLLRRWGREREGTWQLSFQFGVGAGILGLAMLVLRGPERLPLTFAVWGPLLVLVVFSSLLGYVVYFRLHHQIGPGRANLVTYLLPLVGVGLGSGLYGEPITVWEVGGFLLVVAGLSLVFATGNRTRPPVARSPGEAEPPSHGGS
ncbi:MAG TPA: DMT family transporter [Thermoplasmata archaeon]